VRVTPDAEDVAFPGPTAPSERVYSAKVADVPSVMHYGFAQPFPAMFVLPTAAGLLAPSTWVTVAVAAGSLALFVGADILARRRALGRVRRWAAARGVRQVRPAPRGGFVTWGWSLWTFAETSQYRGVDAAGRERELWASYNAPAFGLFVSCQCELTGPADDT
jgi:hypothetical protein